MSIDGFKAGRMRATRLATTFALALSASLAAWAGPVVIDGTDANDHGSTAGGTNVEGWVYMKKVLENESAAVNVGVAKVVADLGTTDGTQARNAINSAFNLSSLPGSGWTLVHISTADINTFLTSLSVTNTGILYIPTSNNAGGDLSAADLAVVNTQGTNISNFVSAGGGLFAMGESPTGGAVAYGWLISLLPSVSVVDVGGGGIGSAITLTADGVTAFPGLSSADLSAGPWHNYFLGNFGGLKVLATAPDDQGLIRNLVIGGGAGTTILPPPPAATCTPTTQQPFHFSCITRDARFWFTHAETNVDNCVTLKRAIELNGGQLCIGFQTLPVEYENNDNVKDAEDALIEALGFYWRSQKRTGEDNGTQNLKLRGSALCRERKRLAVELIAAIANNVLLGTSPTNCLFANGNIVTNFPADLIEQAGAAAMGEDINQVRVFTALLRSFNNDGRRNDFLGGLVECDAQTRGALRKLSRDPMTKSTCPGINDDAAAAKAITSFPYRDSANLTKYSDDFTSPGCGVGGVDVVWKVAPPVAAAGRNFLVDTFKSNVDTLLSVWIFSGITAQPIACNDNANGSAQSQLTFTADGSNTFYIVGEGAGGQIGKLKLRVISF